MLSSGPLSELWPDGASGGDPRGCDERAEPEGKGKGLLKGKYARVERLVEVRHGVAAIYGKYARGLSDCAASGKHGAFCGKRSARWIRCKRKGSVEGE